MTDSNRPNGEAEYLVNHPLLGEIFDTLESNAVEDAVGASSNDDDARRDAVFRIQAIRTLRQQLADMAKPTKQPRRGAVA